MDLEVRATARYPAGLVGWAGHHSGGVRRLFDTGSGRPSNEIFSTNLLEKLRTWTESVGRDLRSAPRLVLLVGGPGNGKTEAIESTVEWLDTELDCQGKLVTELSGRFHPAEGEPVPRLIEVDVLRPTDPANSFKLALVQDASVVSAAAGKTPAGLLIEELTRAIKQVDRQVYLCCVNRGVLDDALIEALDAGNKDATRLLERITRAVSLSPTAPACWPLEGYEDVAVWPMDLESLIEPTHSGGEAPAATLFGRAVDSATWIAPGECQAGDYCPFCQSQKVLSRSEERSALLNILRWYEIASGKRWTFRDLFSLASYLLAGHRDVSREGDEDPCSWAASMVALDREATNGAKVNKGRSTAIFRLVSAQYQHALFHGWDRDVGSAMIKDIRELGLEQDNTAMGMHYFFMSRRGQYLPATIGPLIEDMSRILDPALANPDNDVPLSRNTSVPLRDLDARFSRSTEEGVDFVRKYHCLSDAEYSLLRRLAKLDTELSVSAVRRKRPAAANRLQRIVRDFASRVTRRSLGARTAVVRDAEMLTDFHSLIKDQVGAGYQLFDVAQQVEELLNHGQNFEVSLTTTFGQPLPPPSRRATLVVPRRHVGVRESKHDGRPVSPICYLQVGSGASAQSIALTYDLFKAVKELERGLSQASLPRSVLALLDTTRARLSGPIVRDTEILERASIRLGSSDSTVRRYRGGFAGHKEPRRS